MRLTPQVGLPVLGVVENMSGLAVPLPSLTFKQQRADGQPPLDVTQAVMERLHDLAPELSTIVAQTPVFHASRGGAARMCQDMGVPFLGPVPLDPALSKAGEEGRSAFEDGFAGPCAAPLRAIIQQLVRMLQGGTHSKGLQGNGHITQ